MAPLLARKTLVALGHASQADAFQCGREAAQMAFSQLPGNQLSIGFLFGPDTMNFTDLIEGARLVTGRHLLIAIPTSRVFSNEVFLKDAVTVLLVQSSEHHMTAAASVIEQGAVLSGTTSILTRIRQQRANKRKFYSHHGLLVFDNNTPALFKETAHALSSDFNLDGWMAAVRPQHSKAAPFICHEESVLSGAIVVECLSQNPWGFSQVSIDSFKSQAGIYSNAAKATLREARNSMGTAEPGFALMFFNFPIEDIPQTEMKLMLDAVQPLVGSIPLVGISTAQQFFRTPRQILSNQTNTISTLLGPI
jgi:hypothetical protein